MPAKKAKQSDLPFAALISELLPSLKSTLKSAQARDRVLEQMAIEGMGMMRRFIAQQEEQELRRQAAAQEAAKNFTHDALIATENVDDVRRSTADAVARANFFHSPGPTMPVLTPFVDSRGDIINIAENSVGGVQVIFSKAGSTRAKHFHKTDTHVCYVVSGQVVYKERNVCIACTKRGTEVHPAAEDSNPTRGFRFVAGERFVTGPLVAHQMDFPVDTVMVVMSEHPRDPKSYDADIVKFTESL